MSRLITCNACGALGWDDEMIWRACAHCLAEARARHYPADFDLLGRLQTFEQCPALAVRGAQTPAGLLMAEQPAGDKSLDRTERTQRTDL